MHTEGLIFYHGTTSSAARKIICGEQKDPSFESKLGIAARAVITRIEKAPVSYFQVFHDAGCKFHTTAPIALKNLAEGNLDSLYSYGPFFGTIDPRSAYKYALRGGSEALQCLRDGIRVTDWLGVSVYCELREICPDIIQIMDDMISDSAVVISLGGVGIGRLARENGGIFTAEWLLLMAKLIADSGYSQPATVRISGVSSSDILAVHDLRGHKPIDDPMPHFDEGWSLPPPKSPSDWLAGSDLSASEP